MAPDSPFVQLLEGDGGLGWTYPTYPMLPAPHIATGTNRDIIAGGGIRLVAPLGDTDVYLLRLTR